MKIFGLFVAICIVITSACNNWQTTLATIPTSSPSPKAIQSPTETAIPQTITAMPTKTHIPPKITSIPTPIVNASPPTTETIWVEHSNIYEKVSFSTDDGVEIAGRLFGQEGKTAVILTHKGYGSQEDWFGFATLLADKGFAVLTFDFRGVGQSAGYLNASKLEADVRAAIQYLRHDDYARVICVGASFGGTACMKAALQTEIDSLVVIGSRMSEGYPTRILPDEFPLLTMPKLFICTENDHHNLAAIATEMYEISPEPKGLEILPGSAHATDIFHTAYADDFRQILLNFLENSDF